MEASRMSLTNNKVIALSALVVGTVMIGFAGSAWALPPQHAVGRVVEAPRPVVGERLRPVDLLRIQNERIILSHPETREFMTKTLIEGGTYNGKSIEVAVKDIDSKMEALKKGRPEKELSDKEQKDLADLERQRQDILEKVMKKFVVEVEVEGKKVVQFKFQKEGTTAIEKAREIYKAIRSSEAEVINAIKDGKEYRLSDAQAAIVFANALAGMRTSFESGSPAQKSILATVNRYAQDCAAGKRKPSVALLENVERAMKSLDGATTAEAKSGSEWRTNFDQTNPANIAQSAETLKWGDTQHEQIEEILKDQDAARGLGRFAGFHNRVAKALGRPKGESHPELDGKIGKAVDAWVIAPEVLKKELMQEKNLEKFNENPEKYLADYEAKLVTEHGEGSEQVRKFRQEKEENMELLKKLCKNCPKMFPGACALAK
jgi:hypothetical protein